MNVMAEPNKNEQAPLTPDALPPEAPEAPVPPEAPQAPDAAAASQAPEAPEAGGQADEQDQVAAEAAAEVQASAGADADAELEQEIAAALGDDSVMDMVEQSAAPSPIAQAGDHAMAEGQIVAIHDDDVFVDLGGKSQGVVPLTQFKQKPALGSRMEFVVEGVLGDEGLIKLSRQGAVEKATWQSLERGMNIEAMVTGSNTGGLELKVAGQRAFMPASQIDIARVENFNAWLGKKMQCKVIDLDRRGKRIVLSRRALLEEQQQAQREQLLQTLETGQEHDGTVRNIQPFGAFVDLGGIDGLVHVSDMTWQRNVKPEQVVQVGQTVRVKILKIERGGERISLGMKQVGPNPWEAVGVNYRAGAIVTGAVTKLAQFGAFVELEPGIEGLIPMAELSWDRVGRPSAVVKTGQQVSVKVLDVDVQRQRISLSLKQMSEDPWVGASGEFAPDSEVEGTVTRTADFGAFVEIKPGVEGMIHISELSDKRVNTVEDVAKPGQTVKAKVLSVDEDKRRISLSIRALTAPASDRGGGGGGGKASRDDMRKYVVKGDTKKQATSGESLGALMDKFGGPGGGLKGGIG